MRWLLLALATIAIWSLGLLAFMLNALSECFPQFDDMNACTANKHRDALLIVIATTGLWLASAFLIIGNRRNRS